ncbi:MAG: DNA-processing protein DprA, partial [Candidatus Omnitrophica bacterium]|nr:DNA-processing protein DprA [Candidatus Omnitrophota bacterium]
MTSREALISLNLTREIGFRRFKKLLASCNTPERIFSSSFERLAAIPGIGEKIAKKIVSFPKELLDAELEHAARLKLEIVTFVDDRYPESLKQIYDPPLVLYVKGILDNDDGLRIAIVGSRRASLYGLTNAEKLSGDLAEYGVAVVSGLARGIDTYAHRGAVKRGGRTIAVMGSGFDHLYPEENRELAEEITRCCGAVITEFPIDTLPLRQNFPLRNRIISGLSQGVLVVEAAQNSGALITADCALEQDRDVFALPGKIDSQTSSGTNGLIQQGAKLVCSAQDILQEYGWEEFCEAPVSCRTRQNPEQENELSPDEERIFNLIGKEPCDFDE